MKPAPVVNVQLAQLLKAERNPMEHICLNQGRARVVWALSVAETLTTKGRPVVLECGHFTITKALQRASCPRCGEMIRSGYDHDLFRNHGARDDFRWPDDPLRQVHEIHQDGQP